MICWSAPLYPADRRVASVGAVDIGYVVPPCRIHRCWRWFITFQRGRDAEGRSIDEHQAKTIIALRWRQWLDEAHLLWAPREGGHP